MRIVRWRDGERVMVRRDRDGGVEFRVVRERLIPAEVTTRLSGRRSPRFITARRWRDALPVPVHRWLGL